MHKFGLMYHVPHTGNYVVPAHLPTTQPYPTWPHSSDKEILQFIYEFDKYMPKGLMSRLIVALHHHIPDHKLVWHRGVNLTLNNAHAEIIETYDKYNRFQIRITGHHKKDLLAVIREHFAEVLAPFNNLNYEQLVPCICTECIATDQPYFFKYSDLLERIERGKKSYYRMR